MICLRPALVIYLSSIFLAPIFLAAALLPAAFCQTASELAQVDKITGREQTQASSLAFLAAMAEAKKDYKKAKSCYLRLLEIYKADPGIGVKAPRYAWVLSKLAICDEKLADLNAAKSKSQEALAIIAGQTPDSNPEESNYIVMTRENCRTILGNKLPATVPAGSVDPGFKTIPLSEIKDLAAREKQVKDLLSKSKDMSSPEQLKRALYLANVYTLEKKYADAEPLFKLVINETEKQSGKNSPLLLTPLSNYGYLLKQQGKKREAEAVLKRMKIMIGQKK